LDTTQYNTEMHMNAKQLMGKEKHNKKLTIKTKSKKPISTEDLQKIWSEL